MTIPIALEYIYWNNFAYELRSKESLFVPEDYGLHADLAWMLVNTSIMYGHYCTYEIIDDEILLKQLEDILW